jgi:hypothetical protein
MTEERDTLLQSLFTESQQELDGEEITARVMAKTRHAKNLLLAGGLSAALVILALTWLIFAMPLLEFAVLVAQGPTMTLVDLGEGWLALAFLPVNNIGSLLIITARVIRVLHKRIFNASFAG